MGEDAANWDKRVYVIGGGIAGLTAAHELVERGFDVHVFEQLARPFDARDCEVGGLARTQWCYQPNHLGLGIQRAASLMEATPRVGEILVEEIPFDRGSFQLTAEALAILERMIEKLAAPDDVWTAASLGPMYLGIPTFVEGYALDDEAPATSPAQEEELRRTLEDPRFGVAPKDVDRRVKTILTADDTPAVRLSRCRAWLVKMAADKVLAEAGGGKTHYLFLPAGLGGVPRSLPDEPTQGSVVRFRVSDALVPGEHGYRYFPAFYRHVMDTMKRIPLFETSAPPRARQIQEMLEIAMTRAPKGGKGLDPDVALAPLITASNVAESPRTVLDNLVPTHQFVIANGDGKPPIPIPRVAPRSFTAIKNLVSTLFERLEVSLGDTLRFQTRLFVFMTSCEERRKSYEGVSWRQFIHADRCSEQFQELIERWPQALIGLQAKLADAHTIGTITLQLLLDEASTTGYRDGTLNGPTSRAWLDPWRRYLEARGVRFRRGKLQRISLDDKGALKLDFDPKTGPAESISLGAPYSGYMGAPYNGYAVLAVSPLEAQRLVEDLWKSCDADAKARAEFPRSFLPLRTWPLPAPTGDGGLPVNKDEPPEGTLRHYSGIQLYFRDDLGPAQGHIYFARSAWRLSAISQVQFWQQTLVPQDAALGGGGNYISILSVDIGDWYAKNAGGRRAVECTRDELAAEVWSQIRQGLAYDGWIPPQPFAYHVDDDMIYDGPASTAHPVQNLSPYPVNLAGDWDNHPGSVDGDAYEMFRHLVLAGSYVKTRTRLTTMESANESARRAVNAILDDYGKAHPGKVAGRCQLWDPEENEVDDLEILKDIDAKLMEQGLPHMLEILDVEKLLDGDLGALDPGAVLDALLGGTGAGALAAAGLPIRLLRALLEALLG